MESDPFVSIEEACALTGLDRATLYRWIGDGKLQIRPGPPAANGKPTTEIQVASLPQEAQATYWSQTLRAKWAAEAPAEPAVNLAEIPAPARERAERRHTLVGRILADRAGTPRGRWTARLRTLATHAGESPRTVERWLAAYQRGQFPALIPQYGGSKGVFRSVPPAVQDFVKDQYLTQLRPSPTTVYRRTVELSAHLRLPAPSQATVNRFLRTLPPAAVVLGRIGHDEYAARCEPKCERDLNALGVGAWWVSDHREFDVFVKIAWWDSVKREMREHCVRPWLTAWLDLRSRCCLGWQVHVNPTSETIACALRAGILRHGLPTHLYRDNGKDYTCHYFGGKSRIYKGVRLSDEAMALLRPGVLSAAGIQLHAALPYRPWSKPIESWFGHTFPEWERTLPGWCGRDNKERPEKLERELAQGQLLTLDEFIPRVTTRIADYNATPHSALEGATPNELWDGVAIERPAPRTLDLLLMRHKAVMVSAKGIKLFGRCYWHEALALKWKQQVHVKYDQNELGRLIVFEPATNTFLCEALNQPAMRMGASHEDLKALHQKKRAAKQRIQQYLGDRQVLFNQEQILADLAQQRRAMKVVTLTPPDPRPAPGTRLIPRVVPAMDQAAAAISRTGARRTGRQAGTPQEPRPPVAAPAAAAPDQVRSRDEKRTQADAEREAFWSALDAAADAAAPGATLEHDEEGREAFFRQLGV